MDKEECQQATLRRHRKETKHRRILQHYIFGAFSQTHLVTVSCSQIIQAPKLVGGNLAAGRKIERDF
jgi:hypothetical protein